MNYVDGTARLAGLRSRIAEIRAEMRKVQQAIEPQEVADYGFATVTGSIRLSALFGGRDDLIAIHNMGRSCPYCTLWADGYNGIYPHLADRAAFVVVSPDPPAVQQAFAADRGWRFPLVSHQGGSFAADMGYGSAAEGWRPGISVFKRDGRRILRVSDTGSEPGDAFCALWHFLDLIPEGAAGWQPKLAYAGKPESGR